MTKKDLLAFVRQIERHGGRATEKTCCTTLLELGWTFLKMNKYNKYDGDFESNKEDQFSEMYQDLKKIADIISNEVHENLEDSIPSDGMCHRCFTNPKKVAKTGWKYDFCGPCKLIKSFEYKNKPKEEKRKMNYDNICSICRTSERHVYSTGRKSAYCHECTKQKNKLKEKKKKNFLNGQTIRTI